MTPEDQRLRARRVARLLSEPDVIEAFADVEADLLASLRHTAWDQGAWREKCHAEIRALDRLREKLQTWADVLLT